MTIRLAAAARDAACDAIMDLIDAASPTPGTLKIYSGPRPATADTAPNGGTNTLLATLTYSDPAFGDAGSAGGNADGVAVADTITPESSAVGGEVATWFRVADGNGTALFDGTIKETGASGSADLEIDETTLVTGGSVTVSGQTFTMPTSC